MPKAGKIAAAAVVGLVLAANSHQTGSTKAAASNAEARPAAVSSPAPKATTSTTTTTKATTKTTSKPASTTAADRAARARASAAARARQRAAAEASRNAARARARATEEAAARARAARRTTAPPKPTTPTTPLRVVLWGDSLAAEAQDYFAAAITAHGHATVRLRTFGGTALCDWVQDVGLQIATFHPQVAVIEFAGNAATPCMRGANGAPLTGSAFAAVYRRAGDTVLTELHKAGVKVYWASAPEPRSGEVGGPHRWATDAVNEVARSLTADHAGTRYFPAGSAVLSGGEFTLTLPCRSGEPCTARDSHGDPAVQVRSGDGVHFCPGLYVGLKCGVYSGGAKRYGQALAGVVVRDYDL